MGPRLTESEMRRNRLRGQLLGGRVAAASVEDVVGTLVGVQAQDVTAAALAVRARAPGLTAADVDRAREERRVVLTWTLRGTRHLHLADDVRRLVALLGPAFLGPSRRAEQLGISGAAGEQAGQALHDALAAEGPLTRAEVKAHLARHGVDPSGQAAIHVVRRAALEGWLCVVPGERYVLLDDWLGLPADPADATPPHPGELARRYLAAFGPATPADFAAWSGLGAAAARQAWSAIAGDVVEVEGPSGPSWLLAGVAWVTRRRPAAGVRLLGAFDSLLLAYADRRLHLSPEHASLVNPGGGMVKALVAVDGVVAGTWTRPAGRVEVQPFRPLTGDESAAVEREAADVVRFLTPDPSPRT
ncbi:MAG: hypothetical protein QOI99_311 [Actinomycetota bacterium]|nr:hypothetical protein [Actinomycetota bacterium]